MRVNISMLEVPLDMGNDKKLKENMYLTAQSLYKNKDIEFTNLHRMVSSDFRQYSPFIFNENTKKSENWNNDEQQLLILDVDDGLSIAEAKVIFKSYKYLICTTKSHQVAKKGLKCDRFRVLLVSDNITKGDEYFDHIKNLEALFPFIDKQVNTKTGAFLGSSNCEYWYNEGDLFDFSMLNIKKAPIVKTIQAPRIFNTDTDLPLEDIKNRLNVEVVAEIVNSCGFEVNRNFKFTIREERTPSCSISKDCVVKDFGDQDAFSDVFGFLMHTKQYNFREAVSYVGNFVGVSNE